MAFAHPIGASASVTVRHIGRQLPDVENTITPTADGLRGAIPAVTTLDANLGWAFPTAGIELYVAGRNLTNQVYIASRRPRGIQPAGFLQVWGGIQGAWGRTSPRVAE